VIGFTYKGQPVYAASMQAVGAMQVILRDAIHPNLVQTLEGTPAFVHGGPFANIAQGTNTAIATRMALKLADYVVTEAGFATDLGAEKFFDIKCRTTGLFPSAVVIVATLRAIHFHGGFADEGGLGNLAKHIENIRHFGIDPVVAINRFDDDKEEELKEVIRFCRSAGIEAVVAEHYKKGSEGARDLAAAVINAIEKHKGRAPSFAYPPDLPLHEKIEMLARKMYGAEGVDFDHSAVSDMKLLEECGFHRLPVCVAKTQMSLSDNPKLYGRPKHFRITVNEFRISSGAGFVVAICGNITTMPGLPKVPAAARIRVLPDGKVEGLS